MKKTINTYKTYNSIAKSSKIKKNVKSANIDLSFAVNHIETSNILMVENFCASIDI